MVEGLHAVEVEREAEGFVKKLDGGNDVRVSGVAESEVLEGRDCLGDRVALLPIDGTVAAGIVEPILGAGS